MLLLLLLLGEVECPRHGGGQHAAAPLGGHAGAVLQHLRVRGDPEAAAPTQTHVPRAPGGCGTAPPVREGRSSRAGRAAAGTASPGGGGRRRGGRRWRSPRTPGCGDTLRGTGGGWSQRGRADPTAPRPLGPSVGCPRWGCPTRRAVVGVADAELPQHRERARLLLASLQLPAPLRAAPSAAGTAGAPEGPGAQLAAGCGGQKGVSTTPKPCQALPVPVAMPGVLVGAHRGRAGGCTRRSPGCRCRCRAPPRGWAGRSGAGRCGRPRSCWSRGSRQPRARRTGTAAPGTPRSRSHRC